MLTSSPKERPTAASTHCSVQQKRALARLMRDRKELQEQPCRTVCAAPLEDNMFEWHGNLRPLSGPYAGSVLHIIMNFPEDYPVSPPQVRITPAIPHPNVFGESYICLDMLKRMSSTQPYTGWTTAYSVQSILLQLQAFLFAENIPQEYGGTLEAYNDEELVSRARAAMARSRCSCGHTSAEPYPPLPEKDTFDVATRESKQDNELMTVISDEDEKGKQKVRTVAGNQEEDECWILKLPVEIQLHALQFLRSKQDILSASNTCSAFASLVREYCLLELQDSVICFHSKLTQDEDILGVGLALEYFPSSREKLKAIHTPLDILSHSAFAVDKVRLSVWKEQFDEFLPLVIHQQHFSRAKPLILSCLANLAGEGAHLTWKTDLKLQARIVMSIIPKLMNSFVVSLMKERVTSHYGRSFFGYNHPRAPSVMLSERALEGYCSFHHMLLTLAAENPEIERLANEHVENFLAHPAYRLKSNTPDLGEWLVNLTLARKRWNEVAELFLEELFVRNVRWMLQDAPYLDSLATSISRRSQVIESPCLIDEAFTSTMVSRRLIMFQVYFLTNVGRPEGRDWLDSLCIYNRTMGRPTNSMKTQLHKASKAILGVNSWAEYFDRIGVPRLNGPQLTSLLCSAVFGSMTKSYHKQGLRMSVPMHKLLKMRSRFLEPQEDAPQSASTSSGLSSSSRKRAREDEGASFYPLTPRPRTHRDEHDRDDRRGSQKRRRSPSRSRSRSPRSDGHRRSYRREDEYRHRSRRQRRDDSYPQLPPRGRRDRH